MKAFKKNLILSILMVFFIFGNCESSKEEKDKRCQENELARNELGSIKVIFDATRSTNSPDASHNLFDATKLEFHGEVILIDCRQEATSNSQINCSFNPSVLTAGKNTYSFWISPPDYHAFVFTNKLEYCQVSYYLSAKFSDGKTYRSDLIYASTNEVRYWNGHWDQISSSSLSAYLNWQLTL